MDQPTVAVVDSEPTYRYGIANYLDQEVADVRLIGQASSVGELRSLTAVSAAEILIVSWDLVGHREAGTLGELVNRAPQPKHLVAVCSNTRIETIVSAFGAGATAIVLRNGELEEIGRAVRAIVGGRRYVCPSVGLAVLERLSEFIDGAHVADRLQVDSLSNREREVLALIAKGLTSKEIAASLALSVRTVENHRTNIMRRLDIHSTIGLVRYVVASELGDPA